MSNLLLVESWLSLQLWLLSIFHTPSIITLYVVHVSVRANGSNIVVLWPYTEPTHNFANHPHVTTVQCHQGAVLQTTNLWASHTSVVVSLSIGCMYNIQRAKVTVKNKEKCPSQPLPVLFRPFLSPLRITCKKKGQECTNAV